jgi:hypothetical protein
MTPRRFTVGAVYLPVLFFGGNADSRPAPTPAQQETDAPNMRFSVMPRRPASSLRIVISFVIRQFLCPP